MMTPSKIPDKDDRVRELKRAIVVLMGENTRETRKEFAAYIGSTERTIRRYLSGEFEIPVMLIRLTRLMMKS